MSMIAGRDNAGAEGRVCALSNASMRHNRNINIYRIHMHMSRTACVCVSVCAKSADNVPMRRLTPLNMLLEATNGMEW